MNTNYTLKTYHSQTVESQRLRGKIFFKAKGKHKMSTTHRETITRIQVYFLLETLEARKQWNGIFNVQGGEYQDSISTHSKMKVKERHFQINKS